MINEKQSIITKFKAFTNNDMSDDEIYNLYLKYKLQRSEEDIKNGRVITLQELKRHIDTLEEKYANNNI